jgi:hypothetical protein
MPLSASDVEMSPEISGHISVMIPSVAQSRPTVRSRF